ncbi:uncharacterized protein CXQ87_001901 [Candidozyma duobushaemuli]|nr:uncharacterized protein CXQ87_001901 [[Candida] duobushaemulonis]PVH13783.1 hypothetical protein CXQ87_001901 [[Candida] duobushaemulonis]
MASFQDYESCLQFLETVPEDMQVPQRSAARPILEKASLAYHDSDDEVSSQASNFRVHDSSDHEYGSPKDSIFSACSSPEMPSLSLKDEDDLEIFLDELDEVEIQEITNVVTYSHGRSPTIKEFSS